MCIISPYDKLRHIYIGTGKARKPLSDGIDFINDYVKKPKGDDVDWLDTIWFEELLDQLKTFEADALTTHDLIAAFIQACIGANSLKPHFEKPFVNLIFYILYLVLHDAHLVF